MTPAAGNVDVSHKVLVSVALLVAVAYMAQGAANANQTAHGLVLALLVGVVLLLGMTTVAKGTSSLGQYPWLPAKGS